MAQPDTASSEGTRRRFLRATAIGGALGIAAATRGSDALADSVATVPLVVRGPDGNHDNLQEWQDPSGRHLGVVNAAGDILRPPRGTGHQPFGWTVAGST